MDQVQQVINQCFIQDGVVKLPAGELERKLYEQVAKKLQGIGGKWKGGKVSGFVFTHNPEDLLRKIQEGEKINLKKDFQFFPTPDHIVKKMVELAELRPGNSILEPSAGQGAIIKGVHEFYSGIKFRTNEDYSIAVCEAMPQNVDILRKEYFQGDQDMAIPDDFLQVPVTGMFYCDRIIANPPFTKGQDIDHIMHMMRFKEPFKELIIVTLCSPSWLFNSTKKYTEFRELVVRSAEYIELIDQGEFKESGTEIATCLIKFRL